MKFSPLVDRVKGESVAAWTINYEAREAKARGEAVRGVDVYRRTG